VKKRYLLLFTILLIFAVSADMVGQCAMCKASVESSQHQANSVAAKLNTGILYLMAIPYLLIGFIFRKQLSSLIKMLRGKNISDEA